MDLTARLKFAEKTARAAGAFAHEAFRNRDRLTIESKGHHDLVSQADRDTEALIRAALAADWPEDGILGEEHGRAPGTSGFDWTIDPIDGTANYLAGIPHWCVSLACTQGGLPVVGAIHDPNTGEAFTAAKGLGAQVNGVPMRAATGARLSDGSIGTGASGRSDSEEVVTLVREILTGGGMYFRSASGALMLAYVAAGRLLGHIEDHMQSWDCFAGLIMLEEAGGRHQPLDPARSLEDGTRLVAGGAAIYPELERIAARAFTR